MGWIYNGVDVHESGIELTEYVGFVYQIQSKLDGRKYIGKKLLTKAGTKQVKGKKKKVRKPSDWESYYGSSPRLKEIIKEEGKENFERTILRFCKTLSECSYFESKYIFINDAIVREDYINDWLSCRITRGHMAKVAARVLENDDGG
jgi:hypothetical protein